MSETTSRQVFSSRAFSRRSLLALAGGATVAGFLAPTLALAAPQSGPLARDKELAARDLAARVDQEIRALRAQKLSCSQATLLGLGRACGIALPEETLLALSSGFAGGIGRAFGNGTCGALVAGVMAMGLLRQDTQKGVDAGKLLHDSFLQREGTLLCGDILAKHGRFGHCTDCCLGVGRDVVALLQQKA